jgi:hypothetical protein
MTGRIVHVIQTMYPKGGIDLSNWPIQVNQPVGPNRPSERVISIPGRIELSIWTGRIVLMAAVRSSPERAHPLPTDDVHAER